MKFALIFAIACVQSIQLDKKSKSDPICSSAGCTQYTHPAAAPAYPIDYPVADFGVDHHIKESQASEKAAEESLDHDWTPTKDKDGKWIVPTVDAEFKLAQREKSDDPTCSSDDGSP